MCPRQSSARFFSARLHMTNVARFRKHSMRARKKLLGSCSLLKETIFRRGLDADRGSGDIVQRCLASRRRMGFLLTTESVFQGLRGLFLNGSLPRHARCATRGIYNKRAFICRAMIPAGYLLFCSLRFRASGGQVEMAVGGWSNADVIASNNFLHRLEVKEWRLDEARGSAFAHAWRVVRSAPIQYPLTRPYIEQGQLRRAKRCFH
jgi:hypothetical protein